MKIFALLNSVITLIMTIIKYGQSEIKTSIDVRQNLEASIHLKEVSILLSTLERVEELDLKEEDKSLLTSQIQSKINSLLS